MILQKAIATSGYCSRRKADELIRAEFVRVNGEMATIGDSADPEKDLISVKGKTLAGPEKKIYIKLNKPLGYTCTNKKFKEEKEYLRSRDYSRTPSSRSGAWTRIVMA